MIAGKKQKHNSKVSFQVSAKELTLAGKSPLP